MKKYLLVLIVSLVFTVLLRKISLSIDYDSYKNILSTLLNISSIVFAIIGAWIAIIYPKAIGKVFNKNENKDGDIKVSQDNDDEAYISELVEIAFVSSIVLMCVLIIQFSFPIAKVIITGKGIIYSKYALFGAVSALTMAQVVSIFKVVLANYFFLSQLRKKNISDEIDQLHK